jgi:hypothetical protein
MALYSVRSERQLCERIDTDLLFRWFLDLRPSDEAFDATTFSHNRTRLDDHALTATFFAAVVREALTTGLCSEHFSVDGTLIESLASAKSFRRRTATGSSPATPRSISTDRSGRTTHTPAGPTPRRGCTASRAVRRRGCPTWATC